MCPGAAGKQRELNRKELKYKSKTSSLPESIGTLDGLEVLNLSCPQLLELPAAIGGLKALKELDLRECASLTKLPAAIGELGRAATSCLIGCSSLAALPDTIGELKALTAQSQLERMLEPRCATGTRSASSAR